MISRLCCIARTALLVLLGAGLAVVLLVRWLPGGLLSLPERFGSARR